jgi:lambda repressor-like predicted transcriptional regulator
MRPQEARVPFDRLERLVAVRLGVPATPGGWHGWTNDDMAEVFRISVTSLKQIRHRGALSLDQADRLATAAGWHPAEVWPEW